jgi:hypothetical protein
MARVWILLMNLLMLLLAGCQSVHPSVPEMAPGLTCVQCHEADYVGTTHPPHAASDIGMACIDCHGQDAWRPALFPNHDKVFPLTGKHKTAACASCHKDPNVPPPKACAGCHQPQYDGAKNPDHVALGLPLGCATCHSTSAWQPAKFPNHKFPIVSGKHGGIACATCHTNPAQVSTFSCMSGGCHGKAKTDNKHDEVGNYSYVSAQCYKCHPTGKGD